MNEKSDQKMIFRTNSGPAPASTLKELMARAELHLQAEQQVLEAIPAECQNGLINQKTN